MRSEPRFVGIHVVLSAVALVLAVVGSSRAAPPPDVGYQGQVFDSAGDPLAGPIDIEIGIWDQPSGGTQLYNESHAGVPLVDGAFNLLLGTGSILFGAFDADLFEDHNRYLEVSIDGETLAPRQPFSSVPYALQATRAAAAQVAGDADTLDGVDSTDLLEVGAFSAHEGDPGAHHVPTMSFSELTDTVSDEQIPAEITRDEELVIGLGAKAELAHPHNGVEIETGVIADARIAGSLARDTEIMPTVLASDGPGSGLDADTLDGLEGAAFLSTASDFGRSGVASDLYEGTQTLSSRYVKSAGPDAVSGTSAATMLQATNDGTGAGLRGSSQGHHGTIGYTYASDKAGVFGNNTNGYGVWGNSVNGHAVFGQSTAGRGVKGVSPAGGVYGESTQGLGVEGKSNTNDGVVGETLASDKSGVFGNSDAGIGVTGRSGGASGVLGVTTSTDPADAGVHAWNEGGGPAIRSDGDLYVTGKSYGNIGPSEGAPFPRPAFDSGWIEVTPPTTFTLGVDQILPTSQYDNDNFFIDMMTRTTFGAGNRYVGSGGDRWFNGTFYGIENDNSINVYLGDDYDDPVSDVRIRIWYIR